MIVIIGECVLKKKTQPKNRAAERMLKKRTDESVVDSFKVKH